MQRQHRQRHAPRHPDHTAGTFRAGTDVFPIQSKDQFRNLHIAIRISRIYSTPQTVDQFQVLHLLTVVQIPGRTNTVEALWQDMLQEHTDEVGAFYGETLLFATVSVVFVAERISLCFSIKAMLDSSIMKSSCKEFCQQLQKNFTGGAREDLNKTIKTDKLITVGGILTV